MKGYGIGGNPTLHIRKVGSWWRWVDGFVPRPLYLCWISSWYTLRGHVWWFMEVKSPLALPGIEYWFLSHPAYALITVLTCNLISSLNVIGTNLLLLQGWKSLSPASISKTFRRGWICVCFWHCLSTMSIHGRRIHLRKSISQEGYVLGAKTEKWWNKCLFLDV